MEEEDRESHLLLLLLLVNVRDTNLHHRRDREEREQERTGEVFQDHVLLLLHSSSSNASVHQDVMNRETIGDGDTAAQRRRSQRNGAVVATLPLLLVRDANSIVAAIAHGRILPRQSEDGTDCHVVMTRKRRKGRGKDVDVNPIRETHLLHLNSHRQDRGIDHPHLSSVSVNKTPPLPDILTGGVNEHVVQVQRSATNENIANVILPLLLPPDLDVKEVALRRHHVIDPLRRLLQMMKRKMALVCEGQTVAPLPPPLALPPQLERDRERPHALLLCKRPLPLHRRQLRQERGETERKGRVEEEGQNLVQVHHRVENCSEGGLDRGPSLPEGGGGRAARREGMIVEGKVIAIVKIHLLDTDGEAEIGRRGEVEGGGAQVVNAVTEGDGEVRVVNLNKIGVVTVVMIEGGGAPEIHQIEGEGEEADLSAK